MPKGGAIDRQGRIGFAKVTKKSTQGNIRQITLVLLGVLRGSSLRSAVKGS
jgi:hypothetical protein